MTIEEMAKRLRALKSDAEAAKETYAAAQFEFKQAQQELLEYMDANEIEGVKTEGINFVPTKTIYGQINDRAAFVAWAEENDEELLEPKERKSILNERARQLIDDGEEFPPGMTFRVEEYVSQRSA